MTQSPTPAAPSRAIARLHEFVAGELGPYTGLISDLKTTLEAVDALTAPVEAKIADDWQPTAANVNALPAPVRRYISALETECDPAGTIRSEVILREHLVPELQAALAASKAREEEGQKIITAFVESARYASPRMDRAPEFSHIDRVAFRDARDYRRSLQDVLQEVKCLQSDLSAAKEAPAVAPASPAQLRAQSQAVELWRLLDNIDTLDDACKFNDKNFRDLVRAQQRKRFEVMAGEEWDSLRAAAVKGKE